MAAMTTPPLTPAATRNNIQLNQIQVGMCTSGSLGIWPGISLEGLCPLLQHCPAAPPHLIWPESRRTLPALPPWSPTQVPCRLLSRPDPDRLVSKEARKWKTPSQAETWPDRYPWIWAAKGNGRGAAKPRPAPENWRMNCAGCEAAEVSGHHVGANWPAGSEDCAGK